MKSNTLRNLADNFSVLPVDADPVIDITAIAALYGVTKWTVRAWVDAGKHPAGFKMSDAKNAPLVWRLSTANAIIAEREAKAGEPIDAEHREELRRASAAGREGRTKALRRNREGVQ